eukprot:gene1610-1950_t
MTTNIPAVGPTEQTGDVVQASVNCATRVAPLVTLGGRCTVVCDDPLDMKKVVITDQNLMSAPATYLPSKVRKDFAFVDPVFCQLQFVCLAARVANAEAGWDFGKSLSPDLQQVLLNYAQMSQAAYDQLCSDRCQKRFGQVDLDDPSQVIDYLTTNYPLKPDQSVEAVHPGTADLYDLPDGTKFQDLPPIIHALPGTMPEDPQKKVQRRMRFAFITSFLDGLIKTVTGLLVTFVDGSNGGRQLFTSDPVTGRGRVPPKNGTFMGYITVSKPTTPGGEVDVAIAWRGTIFKEEWESNFGHDELTTWYTSPEDKSRRCLECDTDPTAGVTTPRPWQVGVHDGFDDLYNRPIEQLNGDFISPRQLLRKWLPLLMKQYNVATITTTGHSLGGALSTLSAYGAAELLDLKWDSWNKGDWATKEKPKIT